MSPKEVKTTGTAMRDAFAILIGTIIVWVAFAAFVTVFFSDTLGIRISRDNIVFYGAGVIIGGFFIMTSILTYALKRYTRPR